jgi:predicted double-glycine peptidase
MTRWQGLAWALILSLCASGGSLSIAGVIGSHDDAVQGMVKRHSLKELRDRYIVKQRFDYSCGAAALATLLTYYFGDETSEQDILKILLAELSNDERRRKEWRGFSLLDLKRMAQAKGYRAAGFKLTIEQLTQLAAPVLVFVEPLGYPHFAVLRGIDRGRVFLADPARGNLRMSIARFLDEWHGIVFVLGKAGEGEITTYPLALPRPEHVQPELLGAGRLTDFKAFIIDPATRFQSR